MINTINKDSFFIDYNCIQEKKKGNSICGDYAVCIKKEDVTTVVLTDGLGSGIKANLAAHLNSSHILKLLDIGYSPRETAVSLIKTLQDARSKNIPFSTFSIIHILKNMKGIIVSYESVPPVMIDNNYAYELKGNRISMEKEFFYEYAFSLKGNKTLLVMSDGVTQAGMGHNNNYGIGVKGILNLINEHLRNNGRMIDIPEKIMTKVKELSNGSFHDDTTIVKLTGRKGRELNLLTGPCKDKENDENAVKYFLKSNGIKVVCGSVTADIVSRVSGVKIEETVNSGSLCSPPKYKIKGIHLVTEGILVLNQLYNILDMDYNMFDKNSCVTELALIIDASDIINITVGTAENKAHENISFTQLNMLPRREIIALICEKLKKMNKMVNVSYV